MLAVALVAGTLAVAAPPPAAATVAPAAVPVRVLIWPERGTALLPEVEHAVAGDLRRRVPDVILPDAVPASLAAARHKADQADRERFERTLGEARAAYLAFAFDDARRIIAELLDRDMATAARKPDVLWRALVLAAQVELGAGAPDAARAHLRVVALLPQPPDAASVGPPELARMLADARHEVGAAVHAPLTITSEPAGAGVRLDGAEVGRTPVVLDAGVGRHLVQCEMSGRVEVARIVEVGEAGDTVQVALGADPDDAVFARQVFAGRLDADDPASRAALLARTGASHLATYRQTFFGPEFTVRTLDGQPVLAGRWLKGSPAVAERIADIVLGARAPSSGAVPAGGEVGAEPTPARSRAWMWLAGAGTMLVAAGVAAYLLIDRPEQRAIVRPL